MKKGIVLAAIALAAAMVLVALPAPASADGLITSGRPGLSSFEQMLVASYDTDNAWDLARYLSTPNDGWASSIARIGKVSGTPEERAAAEFINDTLTSYGVEDVAIREYPTTSWVFHGSEVRVVDPELDVLYPSSGEGLCYGNWGTVDAHAYEVLQSSGWADPGHFTRLASGDYRYSFNTSGKDAIVAPLVWVGRGTAKEFNRAGDVHGKIALILRDDYVTQWPTAPLFEAANRGAIAVLIYGYLGESQDPNSVRGDIVCPGPIPAFQTTINVARHLQTLLASGSVTVSMKGRSDIISDAIAKSVYVEGFIYGSKWRDEWVITGSQIDTWFYGPSNSNSGVATNLEIARLFGDLKDRGIRPARTIAFAFVGSEELGNPITSWFDWIGGSYAYVKQHPGVGAKMIADFDWSNVGFKSGTGTQSLFGSWELQGLVKKTIKDLGLGTIVSMSSGLNPFSDMWSYSAVAGGSTVSCCGQPGYGKVYHTWNDTFDDQSKDQYRYLGQLLAVLIHRSTNSLIVPIDMSATFGWMGARLETLQSMVPDNSMRSAFAAIRDDLATLSADWTRIQARAKDLTAAYKAATDPAALVSIEGQADALNRAILAARVPIVNWMVTTGGSMGGWWFYFRGEQSANGVAAIDQSLAALMAGDLAGAAGALKGVFSMDWGHRMSHETYHQLIEDIEADLSWGGEHEQQPKYVDVKNAYDSLISGSSAGVRTDLQAVRRELIDMISHDMAMLDANLDLAHATWSA